MVSVRLPRSRLLARVAESLPPWHNFSVLVIRSQTWDPWRSGASDLLSQSE
jgi:hypothetical protein